MERLLSLLEFLPLIESVRRNEAATRAESVAKGGFFIDALSPRVDHFGTAGSVLGPAGDEPPLCKRQPAQRLLRILADDRHHVRWGNVVAGRPFDFIDGAEAL